MHPGFIDTVLIARGRAFTVATWVFHPVMYVPVCRLCLRVYMCACVLRVEAVRVSVRGMPVEIRSSWRADTSLSHTQRRTPVCLWRLSTCLQTLWSPVSAQTYPSVTPAAPARHQHVTLTLLYSHLHYSWTADNQILLLYSNFIIARQFWHYCILSAIISDGWNKQFLMVRKTELLKIICILEYCSRPI